MSAQNILLAAIFGYLFGESGIMYGGTDEGASTVIFRRMMSFFVASKYWEKGAFR